MQGAPKHRDVIAAAWPIILANAAGPLLGLVDTAVIGNGGSVEELGAIALGALLFNFIYWSFGFLRMGTTGFTAQAAGAGDEVELRATVVRALLLGGAIAVALTASQGPILALGLELLGASDGVAPLTSAYFAVRVWGAPATLASYALLGTLIGLGRSRDLLATQFILNSLNLVLDVVLAGWLDLGPFGVGLGTAIAETVAVIVAGALVVRTLIRRGGPLFPPWSAVVDVGRLIATLGTHRDILIRTLLLLIGFGIFTRVGAGFGDTTLAANHLLLQFLAFSAFFLDGYAHVAESMVGQAVGAKDRDVFDGTVRRTTELAVATAAALAATLALAGPSLIALLTDIAAVRGAARAHLLYAVAYVFLSVWAFQLDGIFIGATRARDMRNAAIGSTATFGLLLWLLVPTLGNRGLWLAFVGYVVARAVTLGALLPRLRATTLPGGSVTRPRRWASPRGPSPPGARRANDDHGTGDS